MFFIFSLICPVQHASYTLDYSLSKSSQGSNEGDSFALDVGGRMMLVPAEKFPAMVEEMSTAFAAPEQAMQS